MGLVWPILDRDKNTSEKERKGFGIMHRSSFFPVSQHSDNRSYYNDINCVHLEILFQQILYKTTCCRSSGIQCIVEPLNHLNVNFDYKARVEMINHPCYLQMKFYGRFIRNLNYKIINSFAYG